MHTEIIKRSTLVSN